ncbi:MAG TPA: dihydrodipicolinate synthase family protein [Thermoguttaceae bacterium]|nr:dihydrodipicolinate synthase family protein [Thermoguttaceae bacterium]
MSHRRLTGLIAAVYTPFDREGRLNLTPIAGMVRRLTEEGVGGIYVCGTTGEGSSLSTDERQDVAQAYWDAAEDRIPVVIQVGHNCLADSCRLAEHAQRLGVHAISANAPSYFRCADLDTLVASMATIAGAAPELPFYYYHIPSMNGTVVDMVKFLERGSRQIPNLVGLKFTQPDLATYQACVELHDGRFDVLWGCDEMLLGALATGARGAVGSTYNIAAPLYRRIMEAFEAGDGKLARRLQGRSVAMVRLIARYPFHYAMKEILKMLGHDFGECRLPQKRLRPEDIDSLRGELEQAGFFDWAISMTPSADQKPTTAPPHFSAERLAGNGAYERLNQS